MSKDELYWIVGLLHIIWANVTDNALIEIIVGLMGAIFMITALIMVVRK